MCGLIDISEDWLLSLGQDILATLLKDRTTDKNIIWATNDYESRGEGYGFHDQITIEKITGENHGIIRPRITKTQDQQRQRSRDKAEVFTPSWVCNAQNNLIDEAWFGRKDVFNIVSIAEDGSHTWQPTPSPITFPEGKTWKEYVLANRLEMACGEAPYLASRYDATTGQYFEDVNQRVGLLDRKLRIITENAPLETRDKAAGWVRWAIMTYQSVYGFEYQGDSLLLARESLLMTYRDFYFARWGKYPSNLALKKIAEIISWNVWQMNGLTLGIPGYEVKENPNSMNALYEIRPEEKLCRVMEWTDYKPLKGKETIFKILTAPVGLL